MIQHELSKPAKLTHPGGKSEMWGVHCSCGYRTAPCKTGTRAQQAANSHVRAQERRALEVGQ